MSARGPVRQAGPGPLLRGAVRGKLSRPMRAAVSVGFRKFRLTGSEPTLRLDLLEIVERVAGLRASVTWRSRPTRS